MWIRELQKFCGRNMYMPPSSEMAKVIKAPVMDAAAAAPPPGEEQDRTMGVD